MDSLGEVRLEQLQEVNKQPILNLLAKSMHLGDKQVKEKVVAIFKNSLLLGQNFHYEVSNRHIDMAMSEIVKYCNVESHDFQASSLMWSMRQVMDFKLANNMLDFKTYIQILGRDLKTCEKDDNLKTFDHKYA